MQALHVVVGVVRNQQGQVLIARRPAHVHQGDLWEFPGGKIESGETSGQALRRELQEELGITVAAFYRLGKVPHDYADKSVLLDVYLVDAFTGEAHGRESQAVQWVDIHQLRQYAFPEANRQIIKMLELPDQCLITGKFSSPSDFVAKLEASLTRGVRLVQLRLKDVDRQVQQELTWQAFRLCQRFDALLLLNAAQENDPEIEVAGLHLTSRQLFDFTQRPVSQARLLSASVHDSRELQQAKKLQADFVLLSPVLPTSSHPGVTPLGWENFKQLADTSDCPVFALGGVNVSHQMQARTCGAYGIAAISALWGEAR